MYPDPQLLVHVCGEREWQEALAAGELRPESLRANGFVHLSTQQQVHLPANRIFAGRTDLVLLYLAPGRLGSPLRWEPGMPTDPPSMRFPHLYGPLPTTAVVHIRPYRCAADGLFAPLTGDSAGACGETPSPSVPDC